jgi:hypothetical protein
MLEEWYLIVKSMYLALKTHQQIVPSKGVWNPKIPLRVKVLMWLVLRKIILTKDYLVKKGWEGDETCRFCCAKETLDHLLFGCVVARFVWGVVACTFNIPSLPGTLDLVCDWILAIKSTKKQKC